MPHRLGLNRNIFVFKPNQRILIECIIMHEKSRKLFFIRWIIHWINVSIAVKMLDSTTELPTYWPVLLNGSSFLQVRLLRVLHPGQHRLRHARHLADVVRQSLRTVTITMSVTQCLIHHKVAFLNSTIHLQCIISILHHVCRFTSKKYKNSNEYYKKISQNVKIIDIFKS